jgi:GxxExxY protein
LRNWRSLAFLGAFVALCENGFKMTENEIATIIVDASFKVHTTLGPGLLESVYESVLFYELEKRGLSVSKQQVIPISYDGKQFEEGFRADLIVEDKIIVELKSVEKVMPVHKKQLLTYLRLSDRKLGLLVNFGDNLIKNGISRVINGKLQETHLTQGTCF